MKRLIAYIFILLFAFGQVLPVQAITKPVKQQKKESLTYNVYFHMGFIWANAGRGVLSLTEETESNGNKRYHGQLAAKSLSVVEHIMKVRDTLDTWMSPAYVPYEFVKKTHEGKYNCIERNIYKPVLKDKSAGLSASNVKSTNVKVHRWRKKGGEAATDADTTHYVGEPAFDMLSLFYTMRKMDFASMKKGESKKFATFPGMKKEWYKVEFCGKEKVTLRSGKKYDTYCVLLNVATKGQSKTPIKAWISTTQDQRPLKVIIELSRIGSIQAEIEE